MVPARTESPAAARRGSPRPAPPPVESREPRPERAWRETLAPYAQAHTGRALLGLATSVVPYLALSVATFFAIRVSDLLVLAVAIPTAAFLVRTFVVFHDCSHSSFLAARRVHDRVVQAQFDVRGLGGGEPGEPLNGEIDALAFVESARVEDNEGVAHV